MKMHFLILFILIDSTNSNSIRLGKECDVCNLIDFFGSSNGYGCFVNENGTLCTCPDNRLPTLNRPCRICQREGICGPSNALCSEESSVLTAPTAPGNRSYYACFCRTHLYKIGEACPQEPTLPPTITTTTTTPTITTSSIITTSDRPNDANVIFVNPLLIVIFVLVYLINL